MSDFDKEAERERLREKYEREEEKREVTERMSELLLQGATMTNAHCQDCGDPIFRYDGQEFCPTCEKAVQRDTGGAASQDAGAGDAAGAEGAESGQAAAAEDGATADGTDAGAPPANGDREEIHVTAPDETRVQFGGESAQDPGTGTNVAADQAGQRPQPGQDAAPHSGAGQSPPEQPSQHAPGQSTPAQQPQAPASGGQPTAGGDLGAAHASLARTVTRLSRQAEAAENLGQQRALLAATREAAEALSAVREANR